MKAVIFLFLMLTPMLVGCTHNYTVRPTRSEHYASLNQHALRKQAIVTLMDGKKFHADKLRFAPDSTSWVDPNTRRVIAVQTTEVSDVRFVRRGAGALEGLGLGLLGGALTGAIIGFADGDDPPESFLSFTAEEKAVIGGVLLGGVGGLLGLPIGAAVGSKDVYRIEHQYPQDTTRKSK
jgi:hypothetical protein